MPQYSVMVMNINCNKNKDVYYELYHCNGLYMKSDNFVYLLKT